MLDDFVLTRQTRKPLLDVARFVKLDVKDADEQGIAPACVARLARTRYG